MVVFYSVINNKIISIKINELMIKLIPNKIIDIPNCNDQVLSERFFGQERNGIN